MSSSRFLIYGLIDPRDGQLRYVGKSCKGMRRPKERHHAHCWNWEENLKREGLIPMIWVVQEFEESDMLGQAEIFWIAYFRKMGCKLTNLTDGGEGSLGCIPNAETRRKMSMARRGKISGMKGKVVPDERQRRISESLKAAGIKRIFTEEHRRKLAAAKLGRPGNNRRRISDGP